MTPGQEAEALKLLADIAKQLDRIAEALEGANKIAVKTAPRTGFGGPPVR